MELKIKSVKEDALKQLPKGAKIEQMRKLAPKAMLFKEISLDDEYILTISINGDTDIVNNIYMYKGGQVMNIHSRLVPMGDDNYV